MNIGFYLLNVDANNQKDLAILKCINGLCEKRPYDNIVLFNSQFRAVDQDAKYYVLHISEAKYFKGLLFDIKSILLTKTFPAPSKQILMVDAIDWQEKKSMPWSFWNGIYMHPDVDLVTPNKSMEKLCELCWKKPIGRIGNFSSDDVDEIIKKVEV